MGLFLKKTLICEKCGKEFQARITIGKHVTEIFELICQNLTYPVLKGN